MLCVISEAAGKAADRQKGKAKGRKSDTTGNTVGH